MRSRMGAEGRQEVEEGGVEKDLWISSNQLLNTLASLHQAKGEEYIFPLTLRDGSVVYISCIGPSGILGAYLSEDGQPVVQIRKESIVRI